MYPYRDLKFIINLLNRRTTVYDEIVIQLMMVLLETHLLDALLGLCHNISYHPALGYRQGTKSWFALTDIRTDQQRTNR